MNPRVLIAGLGNIFLGDDGFGVEVVRRLASASVPAWVRVVDFGVRGLHLAYEIADGGYESVILVDAARMEGEPGTVYLIEPDRRQSGATGEFPDAHGMDFKSVLQFVNSLGAIPGRIYVVGCEPLQLEDGIGLSMPVTDAVDEAVRLIRDVIASLSLSETEQAQGERKGCRGVGDGFFRKMLG